MHTWDELVDVNVQELNTQHKQIIDLFLKLQTSIVYNKIETEVAKIIGELLDYADQHFKTEENYFIQFKFPEAEAHIKEHLEFKSKLEQLQNIFKNNELEAALELIKYLRSWIFNHVATTDKKYSNFFNRRGLN